MIKCDDIKTQKRINRAIKGRKAIDKKLKEYRTISFTVELRDK